MTGRIRALNSEGSVGSIRSEDGSSVPFDSSEVLEYDVACLAVGQLVTFDLEQGAHTRAVNVCIQKQRHASRPDERRHEPARLRYMGFEQRQNVRAYRFERLETGEDTKTFTVSVEMNLFARHHVGIQDGPALCLEVITREIGQAAEAGAVQGNRRLTDEDMLAHLASRPVPRERPRPRRPGHHAGPPPPQPL